MENYRKSSHTVYDLKYHLVWITKYRKPILIGDIATRTRELIREICKSQDVEIIKGHIFRDHVHIFVSVPPHVSVSQLVQWLKGKSSRKMMMEYKSLSRMFWGRHIWAGKILENQIPRQKGVFYWTQISGAIHAKAKMLYVAMFDEMDEGTAIFKCSNHPPAGVALCDYEGIPTDHYLWLTGQAGRMLRGEIPFSSQMPSR